MSTWTSKVPLAASGLLLAACVAGGGTGTVRFATADAPDFAVAAPSGFCVADDSLSRLGASKFAAFTRCNGTGAVLTATVGPPGSGVGLDLSGQALADYFTSTEGRAALSRAGRAATVRVHDVTGSSDAVLVRLTDTAPRPSEIGPGESWRAVLSISGRLVTLAVAPGRTDPLAPAAARTLIERFVAATRAANAS
jgi:hypothetical protein